MANLDFFAARDDLVSVFEFLFSSTDFRAFELASEYGQELREFRSLSDVENAVRLGVDTSVSRVSNTFQLWSPSVMRKLEVKRVALDPRRCNGHAFRFQIEGGALVQLYLGGVAGKVISKSHYGHNTRARAEKWGVASGVNWDALGMLSRKTQYHIGTRLAVDRVPGRPILAQASALWHDGHELREFIDGNFKWTREGLRPVA